MTASFSIPKNVSNYKALMSAFAQMRPCDFVRRSDLRYMHTILAQLGDPHKSQCKRVHVTGTNGKGTVCSKVSQMLRSMGKKTGLYTSPHLTSMCERIQVNGKNISEAMMVKHANRVFEALHATNNVLGPIGTLVCIAFLHFQQEHVDYSVIEVGIGGRIDHTNVIPPPEVAVISRIGLDHIGILGNSVEQIAFEKSGIIKKRHAVIIGPRIDPISMSVIQSHVNSNVCSLIIAPQPEVKNFVLENKNTAICVMKILFGSGFKPNARSVERSPSGRFQRVPLEEFGKYRVIFDVAHNPQGLQALFDRLKYKDTSQEGVLIFGLDKSKDLDGCADVLSTISSLKKVFLLNLSVEELYDNSTVKTALKQKGVAVEVLEKGELLENMRAVGKYATENEFRVIISGSFKTVIKASEVLGIDLPSIPNLDIDTPQSEDSPSSDGSTGTGGSTSSIVRVIAPRARLHFSPRKKRKSK